MVRFLSVAFGLGLLLVGTGCVAVSAKNNRWVSEREAVVVGDQVYVINTKTGRAYTVDLSGAGPVPAVDDCP